MKVGDLVKERKGGPLIGVVVVPPPLGPGSRWVGVLWPDADGQVNNHLTDWLEVIYESR